MKKVVFLVLILVVSFQLVVSQTNPQGHYKIDLKPAKILKDYFQ